MDVLVQHRGKLFGLPYSRRVLQVYSRQRAFLSTLFIIGYSRPNVTIGSIVATREDTHHSSVGPRAQECSCGTCCTHTERYHVFVHAYSPALLFHPGFVHCTSTCNRTFYLLCLCRVSSIIFFCFLFVELIITRVVYKPSKKTYLLSAPALVFDMRKTLRSSFTYSLDELT